MPWTPRTWPSMRRRRLRSWSLLAAEPCVSMAMASSVPPPGVYSRYNARRGSFRALAGRARAGAGRGGALGRPGDRAAAFLLRGLGLAGGAGRVDRMRARDRAGGRAADRRDA